MKKWMLLIIVFLLLLVVSLFKINISNTNNIAIEIINASFINGKIFYSKIDQNLVSLYSSNGKKLSKENYTFIDYPYLMNKEAYFRVQNTNKLYGLIDVNGEEVIKTKYEEIICYTDKMLCSLRGKDMNYLFDMNDGVIFSNKNENYYYEYYDENVSPLTFDFSNKDYSFFLEDDKIGVIDKKGNIIISNNYDLTLKKFDSYSIIYESIYDTVKKTKKGYYFSFLKNGFWNLLDQDVKEIIPNKYERIIYDEKLDVFIANTKKTSVILDYNGNVIDEFLFKLNLGVNSEALGNINTKMVSGYETIQGDKILIDKNFNTKVSNYIFVNDNGYISIEDDFYSFIDFNGIKKLEKFSNMRFATNENDEKIIIACKSADEEKCGLYNTNGEMISDFYNNLYFINGEGEKIFGVKSGNSCGIIDEKGNDIIALNNKYFKIGCNYFKFNNKKFIVSKESKIYTENSLYLVNFNNDNLTDEFTNIVKIDDSELLGIDKKNNVYIQKIGQNKRKIDTNDIEVENFLGKVDNFYFFLGHKNKKYYLLKVII